MRNRSELGKAKVESAALRAWIPRKSGREAGLGMTKEKGRRRDRELQVRECGASRLDPSEVRQGSKARDDGKKCGQGSKVRDDEEKINK